MTKKTPPAQKTAIGPNTFDVQDGVDGVVKGMTHSQVTSALVTHGAMSAPTLKAYSGWGDELGVTDLSREISYAADEVEKGNLGRVERLMAHQFMTLDAIFNNLAQRSKNQEYIKNMETYLRLALKAQSQARATAETLALMKNPMPYIKQANIAQGPQQVNNGVPAPDGRAGNSSFEQTKILENQHGEWLDTGAQSKSSGVNPQLATVEAHHRPKD